MLPHGAQRRRPSHQVRQEMHMITELHRQSSSQDQRHQDEEDASYGHTRHLRLSNDEGTRRSPNTFLLNRYLKDYDELLGHNKRVIHQEARNQLDRKLQQERDALFQKMLQDIEKLGNRLGRHSRSTRSSRRHHSHGHEESRNSNNNHGDSRHHNG